MQMSLIYHQVEMVKTQRLLDVFNNAEQVLLGVVARLGPWLSPVAPAFSVYLAARDVLGWPPVIAALMAVAVESAGVSAFHLSLRLSSWNAERPEGAAVAPAWAGPVLVVVYLIVGITVAVVIGLVPRLIPFVPGLFFVLAGVGYGVLALMADQSRREAAVRETVIRGDEEKRARSAWLAALRERGISASSATARRALAEAGGDYLQAIEYLPATTDLAEPREAAPARVPAMDSDLRLLAQRAGDRGFSSQDVQAWLGCAKSKAYQLLKYGQWVGVVRRVAPNQYQFEGVGNVPT
jgi:hypothetical protein